MDKKEYLLQLLDKLGTDFPMALGIKYLIEKDSLSDDMFEKILDIFKWAVDSVVGWEKKEKLEQGLNVMEKIKQEEFKISKN